MNGSTDKLKGKAKQVTGDATGNDKMKAEGQAQEIAGKAKDMFGNIADKVAQKVDETKAKNK